MLSLFIDKVDRSWVKFYRPFTSRVTGLGLSGRPTTAWGYEMSQVIYLFNCVNSPVVGLAIKQLLNIYIEGYLKSEQHITLVFFLLHLYFLLVGLPILINSC